MPSSPMMTLPSPRTKVFAGLLVTLLPLELPSTDNRGYGAAPLDVVMIEGKIDVNDDKRDKEPQEKVMPEAHAEFPAHQRHNPGEHAWQPGIAHAGVERKSGNGLRYKRQE